MRQLQPRRFPHEPIRLDSKPPTRKVNSCLGHHAQRIERAPWSERCLDVGKRTQGTQGLKLCCLWTHCECWQISCTHYIHVGSGPGDGLEAWRRLHKRWGPLTTGRARGLLREILPLGRAKLGELQGAVERLDVKISSQRTRATLPTPTVTVGRVSETERRSRLPRGSKRIRCTQTGSSCEGSSGQRRPYGRWRVRTNRSRRRWCKGLLGKDTAATEPRTIEFFWKRKRCERQVRQRWRRERQIQRCWSTCLNPANWKSICEFRGLVHRRLKLAQLRWV